MSDVVMGNAADVEMEKVSDERPATLLLSMDYGTRSLSVSYRIAKPGKDFDVFDYMDVRVVKFDTFDYAPQKAAWDKEGNFYWGHAVDKYRKRGNFSDEDVHELWKLDLYDAHQSANLTERIREKLGARDVDQLMAEHLRAVVAYAREYIKENSSLKYTAEDFDRLPMKLFLSVPQMWTPDANKRMTEAAKEAGIPFVELIYEPQCAAAYHTYFMNHESSKQLKTDDIIITVDGGAGTLDTTALRVCDDSAQGAKIWFKTCGSGGALCGSQLINEHFITEFRTHQNFATKCAELGLSEATCIRRASEVFEELKKAFDPESKDEMFIAISGRKGAACPVWRLDLETKDMEAFFKPVVDDVLQCVAAQVEQFTGSRIVLFFIGGFSQSVYLRGKISEAFGERAQMHTAGTNTEQRAVPDGGLLRFNNIIETAVPSTRSFGIDRTETLNAQAHPDAYFKTGDLTSSRRPCRDCRGPEQRINSTIVEVDLYHPEKIDVVHWRWCSIVKKGQAIGPRDEGSTIWLQICIPVTSELHTIPMYWTQNDIQDHEPIRAGKDSTLPLKDGIKLYDTVVISVAELKKRGHEQKENDQEVKVYEIFCRLVLIFNGANISAAIDIADPGSEPFDPRTGEELDLEPSFSIPTKYYRLYDATIATHNPIPREALS